jgi:hypothetical protein
VSVLSWVMSNSSVYSTKVIAALSFLVSTQLIRFQAPLERNAFLVTFSCASILVLYFRAHCVFTSRRKAWRSSLSSFLMFLQCVMLFERARSTSCADIRKAVGALSCHMRRRIFLVSI